MIRLYTIGFTKKSAETFFTSLEDSGVRRILDTRISPHSQLSGFAKAGDLKFFAGRFGLRYEHKLDFAPTKALRDRYRKKLISWDEYAQEYLDLLDTRRVGNQIRVEDLDGCCLLCSEHRPERCHRWLLAEYLRSLHPEIEIVHLTSAAVPTVERPCIPLL